MAGPFAQQNGKAVSILGANGKPYRDENPVEKRAGPFADKNGAPDDFALPHVLTFSGLLNAAWRTYYQQGYDEARRKDPMFALIMRNDCFLTGLMQEATLGVVSKPWQLAIDDEQDERQRFVRDHLTKQLRAGPRFREMVYNLSYEGRWYGRAAIQHTEKWDVIDNVKSLVLKEWMPVNGDKIDHTWDHRPTINVYSGEKENPEYEYLYTDLYKSVVVQGRLAEHFLFHAARQWDADFLLGYTAAEAVHGSGVRNDIFWCQWLRLEYMGKVSDYLDRVGMGLTVWYYELGNEASYEAVLKASKEQSGKVNILIPRSNLNKGQGLERIETPISGAEAITRITDKFEEWIRIYVVGQTLSSNHKGSGGLGGSGAAEFQGDTKEAIAEHEANNLGETLTKLVTYLQKHTFPATAPGQADGFSVRLVFGDDARKGKERLETIKLAAGLVEVKASDVYKAARLEKPTETDEVCGGPQMGMEGMEEEPQEPGAEPQGEPRKGDWKPQHGPRGGKWEVNAKSGTRRHAPPITRQRMLDVIDRYAQMTFDFDQPREPEGSPEGGRWVSIGGSEGEGGSNVRVEKGHIVEGHPAVQKEMDFSRPDDEKRKAQREKLLAMKKKDKKPANVPAREEAKNPWAQEEEPESEFRKEPKASMSDDDLRKAKPLALPAKTKLANPEMISKAWNTVSALWPEMASKITSIDDNVSSLSSKEFGIPNGSMNPFTGELSVKPGTELSPETLWHELVHMDQASKGRLKPRSQMDSDEFNEVEIEARTRSEYAKELFKRLGEIQSSSGAAEAIKAANPASRAEIAKRLEEKERTTEEAKRRGGREERPLPVAKKAPGTFTGKDPHTLTLAEFEQQVGDAGEREEFGEGPVGLKVAHRHYVQLAVRAGYEIPPEVLAEYPEVLAEIPDPEEEEEVKPAKPERVRRLSPASEAALRKAVERGEELPAHILKEYPDLAQRLKHVLSGKPDRYAQMFQGMKHPQMNQGGGWKDQAREPAGSPEGGQWTTMGAHSDPATGAQHVGGMRVKTDGGFIVQGGPAHLLGHHIDDLGKDSREHRRLSEQGFVGQEGFPELVSGELPEGAREARSKAAAKRLQDASDFDEMSRMPLSRKQESAKRRGESQKGSYQSRLQGRARVKKEAEEAGIAFSDVQGFAEEIRRHDKEFAADRKKAVTLAYEVLKNHGVSRQTIKTVMEHGGDFSEIPGFDTVPRAIGAEFPHLFKPYEGDISADEELRTNPSEKLWEMLAEGAPEPMAEEEAYRQALEHLMDEKESFRRLKVPARELSREEEEEEPRRKVEEEEPVPFRMAPGLSRADVEGLLKGELERHRLLEAGVVKPVYTKLLRDPVTKLLLGKVENLAGQDRYTVYERDAVTSEIVGKTETFDKPELFSKAENL